VNGLRARIVVTALLASGAALVTVFLLVAPDLSARLEDTVRARLLAEARLVARLVETPLALGVGGAEIDAIADSAARDTGARVTIVAPDGRVLGESTASGEALGALANHADRPEIKQALANGEGSAVRHSATVEDDLLYVAVSVRRSGRLLGVARVAVPLTGVAEQAAALRRAVAVALVLAFALTAALAALSAPSLAGPLREIMEGARRFATGDMQARIRVSRHDELGELAEILNQSAERLDARFIEGARDRARTEAILKAMEDGVLAVDHKGIVALANDALRNGLEMDDPVGRHYLEAIRQREVGEVIEQVLKTAARFAVEVEIRHLRRFFAIAGVPFPGDQGAPHGAVLTFHDVTERHRVERIRRDFVANASHELRTPLTSIRGFVEALEDGAVDEPPTAKRFLGKIRTHADRMAALVQDLLDLSRLEAGERPPRFEMVEPTEIAEDVLNSFLEPAGRKGITLRHVDAGARPVSSDADRLRRIVENFVDNAVKYTPDGGHVTIHTLPHAAGGARIEVDDDGPGIPPEHLSRIFERFYRVDKARSREVGGTGLGLAIVKHLAEGMGATVSVASNPEKGTRFTVTLPAQPSPVGH